MTQTRETDMQIGLLLVAGNVAAAVVVLSAAFAAWAVSQPGFSLGTFISRLVGGPL